MKFLCDRCNTRYSIGDERVRGKILKIRCKNCANVITVREGMAADPDGSQPSAPEYPGRTKKTTTIAPAAMSEGSEAAKPTSDLASLVNDRGGIAGSVGAAGRGVPGGPTGPDAISGLKRPGGPAGLVGTLVGAKASDAKDTVKSLGSAQAKRAGASDSAGRGPAGAGRRAAAPSSPRGEPVNALGAAFASAMAKPPPALEEEWYVSLDGEQAGPFSLAEAQGWVAQQAEDAELHCWSEGFDDWLPVDKVSHFRGFRKRPASPTAPPPLPRSGGIAPRGAPASVSGDDESKPLFAATMASIERGAAVAAKPGLSLPLPAASPARATPPLGAALPSRGGLAGRAPNGAGLLGREPGGADNGAKLAQATRVSVKPAGAPAGPAFRSVVGDPFDISESGDAATQLEAMPFTDPLEPRRTPPPVVSADRPPSRSDAALTSPHLPAASTLSGTGANAAVTTAAVTAAGATTATSTTAGADFGKDGDEELAIGEVSRVVKLADITRAPRNPEGAGATRRPRPPSVAGGRRTGGNPILRSTGSLPSLSQGAGAALDGAPAVPDAGDPGMTLAPMRKSHRRGLIALLGVAGVMVLGVIGAVVLLVTTNDEPTGGNLDSVRDIDTSRPEDPITHRPIDPGPVGSANPPADPFVPRPPPHPRPIPTPPAGSNHEVEPLPQGNSLRGDEIEDVARKHQDVTQRCYLRSQRGADSILIGDVKKIAVTLMIDKDGNVNDVQLSDHAADNLGKCLASSIRGWKFRQSSGGTFRFSLNFVSG